ncbi:DUF2149 domain-containing protein [uncultured Methanobrevibacter sp.]|uniref:DUF2149 domain-containing protein n=1 Tax=uncultured Methanobrevibacter sp. TaxID=253161 RepID=UPI0025DF6FEA|nr:DUF2149 domain-containing protein [uncultured Methanobrevibacter sp.]
MVRKKQRRRSRRVEEDPMAGTANLVDAMLVIAVGFLVFVIISWNMQSIVFNEDMTQQEKQQVMQTIKSVSEVNQGQQLNETPDSSNSSGQGYTEMGKVYKDPSTGKLIMVEG